MAHTTTFIADDGTPVLVTYEVQAEAPGSDVIASNVMISDVEPSAYWGEAEVELADDELLERAFVAIQDFHLDRAGAFDLDPELI